MSVGEPNMIRVCTPHLPPFEALRPYLEEIDASHRYTNFGPLVRRLEKRLGDHFGVAAGSCVTVANGTLGLFLALKAAELPPGCLCVLPSWTFSATAHAVVAAGLRPYFADVNPDSWALEPRTALLEAARAPGPVRAVVPVAPFGAPIDVSAWDAFEEQTGISVVIDAAAAFDSIRPGRAPAIVSLHATKVMGAGEGGLVLSQDPDVIERIRRMSNFGFIAEREAAMPALNAKLSEYTAAVALAALDEWPGARAALARVARHYGEYLAPIEGIALRPGFGAEWVSSTAVVELPDTGTADIAEGLSARGIETRRWWNGGCHDQAAFRDYLRGSLTVTERLAKSTLGLPFHRGLGGYDVAQIALALETVLYDRRPKGREPRSALAAGSARGGM